MQSSKYLYALFLIMLFGIGACTVSGPGPGTDSIIPEQCALPNGISVTSISIDTSSPIELQGTNPERVAVTATLSGPVPDDGMIYAVCFEVKDSEIVRGSPLTIGFVPFLASLGTSNTNTDAFRVVCNADNEVTGQISPITRLVDARAADADRSSGERSTRIRVQHLEGIESLFNIVTVGVAGERSDRIRVECP